MGCLMLDPRLSVEFKAKMACAIYGPHRTVQCLLHGNFSGDLASLLYRFTVRGAVVTKVARFVRSQEIRIGNPPRSSSSSFLL